MKKVFCNENDVLNYIDRIEKIWKISYNILLKTWAKEKLTVLIKSKFSLKRKKYVIKYNKYSDLGGYFLWKLKIVLLKSQHLLI